MKKGVSKLEKFLEIIKALHEPKSRDSICKEFEIEDRTFRNYFNNSTPMKVGKVVFSHQIKDDGNSREVYIDGNNNRMVDDKKLYKSSMHPILLPLNMTEVYMLTNCLLDMLDKNSPEYENYRHLASKIYSQLSPYAKKCLGDNRHFLDNFEQVVYESELEMYDHNKLFMFHYAEKSRDKVRVTFLGGRVVEGRVGRKNGKLVITKGMSNEVIPIERGGIIEKIEIL